MNDNAPTFIGCNEHVVYEEKVDGCPDLIRSKACLISLQVPEDHSIEKPITKLMAEDGDWGENGRISYQIKWQRHQSQLGNEW